MWPLGSGYAEETPRGTWLARVESGSGEHLHPFVMLLLQVLQVLQVLVLLVPLVLRPLGFSERGVVSMKWFECCG